MWNNGNTSWFNNHNGYFCCWANDDFDHYQRLNYSKEDQDWTSQLGVNILSEPHEFYMLNRIFYEATRKSTQEPTPVRLFNDHEQLENSLVK
jgi:hypothetical protein